MYISAQLIILISKSDVQGSSYLSHGVRQNLNDLLVRRRHDALAVDLDDAVTDADASSLSDASSHQAADLCTRSQKHNSNWQPQAKTRG